jgi:hypothetical protein
MIPENAQAPVTVSENISELLLVINDIENKLFGPIPATPDKDILKESLPNEVKNRIMNATKRLVEIRNVLNVL